MGFSRELPVHNLKIHYQLYVITFTKQIATLGNNTFGGKNCYCV